MKVDTIAIQAQVMTAVNTTESCRRRMTTGHQRKVSPACQIRLIATKEFSDRFRSGWVLVCVLVWLGAIGLTSFLGLLQIGRIGVQGYDHTVISLLNLVASAGQGSCQENFSAAA